MECCVSGAKSFPIIHSYDKDKLLLSCPIPSFPAVISEDLLHLNGVSTFSFCSILFLVFINNGVHPTSQSQRKVHRPNCIS